MLSGGFVALVVFPDLQQSRGTERDTHPSFLMTPNSTKSSQEAGDAYLRLMKADCGADGRPNSPTIETSLDKLQQLYELSKVPTWTFSNKQQGLYLRQGRLNGDSSSWWNWSISLGDAVTIGSHLVEVARSTCRDDEGSLEKTRRGVVGALRAGSLLLEGNPTLITGLVGVFWGEKATAALEECHLLRGDKEIQGAIDDYIDLCTIEPGVEWETIILPALVPGYHAGVDEGAILKMRDDTVNLKQRLQKIRTQGGAPTNLSEISLAPGDFSGSSILRSAP